MKLSVCIATYRRTERLEALLLDLARQDLLPDEVVVVDNDAEGSASAAISRVRDSGVPFPIVYGIQPERNISLTRNRTVSLATGDWLAFVDDDERAPPNWLSLLVAAADRFGAQGVLGPVQPQVPDEAPAWIRRGRFYDFPRLPTGEVVPLNRMRFGNLILRGEALRGEPGPFDASYGLSMGEDAEMLVRLAHKGYRIVWCDEAEVFEPIEAKRLSLRWLSLRALGGGEVFARLVVKGKYRPITLFGRLAFLARVVAQVVVATGLCVLSLPFGRHRAAHWWITLHSHLGKLSVFLGSRLSPYA